VLLKGSQGHGVHMVMMMMMMMDELTLTCRIVLDCKDHEKLAVMTMPELTLADCSKQMWQLPGRHGRQW